MFLYHGTTMKRAEQIIKDKIIKSNVKRHYTQEKSGFGCTTQGYVYLTNEITFSVYFANHCNLEDKTDSLVLFKVDIPSSRISPDYDEIKIQEVPQHIRNIYKDDLEFSLMELKSCRVNFDIKFDEFDIKFCVIDLSDDINIVEIIKYAGLNYDYVKNNYTDVQINFIDCLKWKSIF